MKSRRTFPSELKIDEEFIYHENPNDCRPGAPIVTLEGSLPFYAGNSSTYTLYVIRLPNKQIMLAMEEQLFVKEE